MAKGDGKRSRPKAAPPPPPPPPSIEAPSASRVVHRSGTLSVRKQIALVRAYEKRQTSPSKPAVRTSFRRKKEANRTADDDGPEVAVNVTGVLELPTMFVDGYNVINAWPRLKKQFAKGDLFYAREMLLSDVADFTIRRFDTVVVFDANGAAEASGGRDREDEYAGGLVRVVYAAESADAYIEAEARRLRGDGKQVWAATSDSGITTACSVHGAMVVSAKWLVGELKAVRKTSAVVVDDFNQRQARLAGRGPTLWDVLDESTRQQFDADIAASELAKLPRRAREALEAARAQKESGGLELGAAARRRQRIAAQQSKRRAPRRERDDDVDDAP